MSQSTLLTCPNILKFEGDILGTITSEYQQTLYKTRIASQLFHNCNSYLHTQMQRWKQILYPTENTILFQFKSDGE